MIIEHIDDYVSRNSDIGFDEKPFNEVDALILSQFAYMKWEGLIPELKDGKEGVTLLQLDRMMNRDEVFMDERYAKDNITLWKAMISGKRYRSMECNYFCDRFDEDIETQFCAFTVFPKGALPVVLFRGTDESLLGWKEDFNMAFSKPVAGQKLASMYLRQVSLRFDGEFNVAGHSKGGNLAVYAGMTVDKEIQDRIVRIYNFDGPGFRPEVLQESKYELIKDKVDKMIPKSSLVGMLLENHEEYSVVKCAALSGVLQHNPYTWMVKDDEFDWDDGLSKYTKLKNDSINKFVLSLDEEQLQVFVDTLFAIAGGAEAATLLEIAADWKKNTKLMLQAMKDIDEYTKAELKKMLKEFGTIFNEELKNSYDN